MNMVKNLNQDSKNSRSLLDAEFKAVNNIDVISAIANAMAVANYDETRREMISAENHYRLWYHIEDLAIEAKKAREIVDSHYRKIRC